MNITTQRWTQERRIGLQLASGHFILYICSYGMPIWQFYFVKSILRVHFTFLFVIYMKKSDKEIFLAQLIGNLKCFYRRYLNSRVWIIPLHCKFVINEISKNQKKQNYKGKPYFTLCISESKILLLLLLMWKPCSTRWFFFKHYMFLNKNLNENAYLKSICFDGYILA